MTNNIYDEKITLENVTNTWNIVRKTCKNRRAIFKYKINKNINNYIIYKTLKEKKYKPLPYRLFLIFEPKARLVMSQTVGDKIINHFVTNYYLLPYLEKTLIDQNVATRKNKGSSYANKLIIDYINKIRLKNKDKEIYCLKLDISKYFYSIDHNILIKQLMKKIKDKDVINLIKIIISETNKPYINELITKYNYKYNTEIPLYKKDVGLSIGAMSSQFLAIFYLSDLDYYIKEKLHMKYYIRYMDDFIIFDIDKEKLKNVKKLIEKEIIKLKLKLNPKSDIYSLSGGISFLGFSYKLVNSKLKITYRKQTYNKVMKKLNNLKKNNKLKYYKSYASYYGYLSKLRKYERNFKMDLLDKYKYYEEKYPNHIIIIKDNNSYKTFNNSAIIIWNIFNYRWNKESITFSIEICNKIIKKLNDLQIGYVIINNDNVLNTSYDIDIFNAYYIISSKRYEQFKLKEELLCLLDSVLSKSATNGVKVKEFLMKLDT